MVTSTTDIVSPAVPRLSSTTQPVGLLERPSKCSSLPVGQASNGTAVLVAHVLSWQLVWA
jgi:hypothetical protein